MSTWALKTGLRCAALAATALIAACGGGDSSSGTSSASNVPGLPGASGAPPTDRPQTQADAARFLQQATFGATQADIDRLMSIGYTAWLNEQFAMPVSMLSAAKAATVMMNQPSVSSTMPAM